MYIPEESHEHWVEIGMVAVEQDNPIHSKGLVLVCYQQATHFLTSVTKKMDFSEAILWEDNLKRFASCSERAEKCPMAAKRKDFNEASSQPDWLKKKKKKAKE